MNHICNRLVLNEPHASMVGLYNAGKIPFLRSIVEAERLWYDPLATQRQAPRINRLELTSKP